MHQSILNLINIYISNESTELFILSQVLDAHMKSHKVLLTLNCKLPRSRCKKQIPCNFSTRMRTLYNLHLQSHSRHTLLHKRTREKYRSKIQSKLRMMQHNVNYHSRQQKFNRILLKQSQSLAMDSKGELQKSKKCNFTTFSKFAMPDHLVNGHNVENKSMSLPEMDIKLENCTLEVQPHSKTKYGSLVQTFSCGVCGYVTRHKNSLFTHMRTHTHDRPYKCHICEYSAIQKVHLDAHMYKHNGVLPFNCSLCRYKCATKASLKAHMCKHTGIKPYKCDFCDYRSARKADRKKHISIKHKEEFKVMYDNADNENRKMETVLKTGSK